MTRAPAQREAGFTLVEVMVALMIFGMIAAAGVAILAFSIRAQGASAARLDATSAMARTVAALTADLAQASLRPARDEGGTQRPAFVGEPGAVMLVRGGWTNIDAAPRPGAQKVAWRVDGTTLQRIGYPQIDGAQPIAAAPMLTGLREARFRYRYRGAWSDRWDGAVGAPLPQALELSLVAEDGMRTRAMFLVGTGYQPTPRAPGPGGIGAP